MEEQITYPCFYRTTKSGFETLNSKANALLGFPNASADTYCNAILDESGRYWFTVSAEVASLVDLEKCVLYEDIVLPEPKKIG